MNLYESIYNHFSPCKEKFVDGCDGSLYYHHAGQLNFQTAKSLCQSKGASLVVTDSQEKQDLVDNLFSSAKYWLALFDECGNNSCYRWIRGDGTKSDIVPKGDSNTPYTNWAEGEPNNGAEKMVLKSCQNENCGWVDVYDSSSAEVICQKSNAGAVYSI